jgi:hypothetical protein
MVAVEVMVGVVVMVAVRVIVAVCVVKAVDDGCGVKVGEISVVLGISVGVEVGDAGVQAASRINSKITRRNRMPKFYRNFPGIFLRFRRGSVGALRRGASTEVAQNFILSLRSKLEICSTNKKGEAQAPRLNRRITISCR